MIQLILHGIGDYFIQNDWMALNKKKPGWLGTKACLIHCLTYSLPFLLIGSWWAVGVIFITHYIIDRTNIVSWLLAVKNGVKVWNGDMRHYGFKYDTRNFGYSLDRPGIITIWLNIICDNLLHIICNFLALTFL